MQKPCQVYFLPIGGTAMAPLAGLLHESGVAVCGVDTALYPPMSELLAELKIPVRLGYDPEAIPDGLEHVVIGNAVPRTNPEVQAVLARGVPFTSQAAAFGERFCRSSRAVVVAGTHGKTTTTAMCAHVFTRCGLDPTTLIGGVPCGGRPWRLGRGGWTVVEGDEYNTAFFDKGPKFLHYYPHFFVVGNVEFDHGDIYANLDAIVAAFRAGTALVEDGGAVVANLDDPGARAVAADHPQVVWYGHDRGADLRCLGWGHADGKLVASLGWRGSTFTVGAPLVGRHNLDNVMATCSCALLAGLDPQAVDAALRSFPGVRRRLEVVGEVGAVTVVDDFAHHPTAVKLTLEGARFRFPNRRVVAVFEPRSLTAGRPVFAHAYERALSVADLALIAPVFHRQRLGPQGALDRDALAAAVARQGGEAVAIPEDADILTTVRRHVSPGDVVICMSSGDFGGLPRRLLESLRDEG